MRRFLVPSLLIFFLFLSLHGASAFERQKLNFNADWLLAVGESAEAAKPDYDDAAWQHVTLPYAFNGDEAFRKDIVDLTDTVVWYRKEFKADSLKFKEAKVFIEFEGARQGADVWLNGQKVGFSDNGVMAFGFDLTPYIKEGENVLAVRCDNSWTYRDRVLNSRYQWNDRNFNANYGGLPKNVWLHVTGKLYQTLPLYSDLGTTGTYVYATDFDIPGHKAVIHAESEVRNEDSLPRTFIYNVQLFDMDGREVAQFHGDPITIQPGETLVAKVQQPVSGLHFWSWGYGYLYTVRTSLEVNGSPVDAQSLRTGFRKTRFGEGKIWLNDRVMMVHGYAQRTSNEWPGVGISVPAWLSDYSNGLMVESGGNMVRWMHVTPWKQDIESCDRVGLPQAMPAGDSEKDVEGARWQQRTALMRYAIIYNRNNPSILFYESGNESISREHMLEMKAIRDQYDPHGGRAIGSREMLDIDEAEYGGEMLYINKSKKHPMWAMEYCRDEGLRKYWNEWSYPYHKEGDGPLYRGKPATEYNHNMDQFAIEMVRRWYDYWRERPGTGTRVSSGGVKIVFSDTNTHHRGESNYRTSGVVDAMRIPKDAFYAHQVMWNGWVEPEQPMTYIVGHWNYQDPSPALPVYVVSTADAVELFLNGRSLGKGKQQYRYLFTFENVPSEPGTLEAVGSDGSRYKLESTGEPYQLKLTAIKNPEGTKADGADMVLFQVEVVDAQGRRCPLDDRMIHFELDGEATWIGGIATRNNQSLQRPDDNRPEGLLDAAATKNISDNYVGATSLPVECGVNRVLVRTTTTAGTIRLTAHAEGLPAVELKVESLKLKDDSSFVIPHSSFLRGETPLTPSYTQQARGIAIASAKAGYDSEHAARSFDDNELSEWKNDGRLSTAWITYKLAEKAVVDDICLKLTGWRLRSYPLEVYAGKQLIWSGETERSLGYIHLTPSKRVRTDEITIRLKGAGKDEDAFGGIVEVAEPAAGELDLFKAKNGGETKNELRIVEIEFTQP
ncbi:MAG: glycoside hydrolase family 2 protein [Prevotella sp.]|nr:glycoside hydrolase family 2 protein [Prevotella sp.]